jgi:SAM-dependent methyltransferase
MANEFATDSKHSAEYFGDSRNYWWNDDFLALALRRWAADNIRDVLDVGCGVGHWSRAWARVLPPEVKFTGVDREPTWAEKAAEGSRRAGFGVRARYLAAPAEALPFPDHSFDFVTCQTVLIHVADVSRVLSEMKRVTRPGGLIVAAEPNNAAVVTVEDALGVGLPVDQAVRLVGFHLTCLRGKAALGLGDETIGRDLPRLFHQAGLENISVCQNEKACPMFPPYATPRERALIEELTDWASRDFWIWSRDHTSRYFAAGGGLRGDFEPNWGLARDLTKQVASALKAGKYSCGGGALFYLVAGRKAG